MYIGRARRGSGARRNGAVRRGTHCAVRAGAIARGSATPPKPIRTATSMLFDRTDEHPGGRLLFLLACLVIVVAGLKVAAPILVPFALALFMAVVSMPVM